MSTPAARVLRMHRQLQQSQCESTEQATAEAAAPPVVHVDEEGLPAQPFLKKQSQRLGGLFTVRTPSGKERVVLTDPALFDDLFYPDEKNLSRLNAMRQFNERGFKWRGGGIADPTVLDDIRRALNGDASEKFANAVGDGLVEYFQEWPDEGEKELFSIAHLTLYPVSQQLFGNSFSEASCPALKQVVVDFDEEIGKQIYEQPLDKETQHVKARKDLEKIICDSLANEANTKSDAPLFQAVYGNEPVPAKWGKFGTSNIWAAQGNTIPATFWTMAFILADETHKHKVVEEVDKFFHNQPQNGKFDVSCLVYLDACFREALRLKGTGAEFRVVLEDHEVQSKGRNYSLKKGEEVYNSSFFMHYEETIFENPYAFIPERWLGLGANKYLDRGEVKTLPEYSYIPFGAGMHVCAGRFLAKAEIVIFIALFFRDFDSELVGALPGTLWRNAIGVVRPDNPLSFRYKRRKAK